ncbi:hypothetical protein BDV98DRAFT_566808 [Pterulicium gracile]|uniref:Yeast cell wall synthesis Kre9/Knh1-like N-terminal domain-containing protein n=1 Tax=Pterulicium gracile TaxID=1884261 RepID=A0A5C3QPC0_9AGAR|nr:hypothetical protein BDV98DRAFT_566808 [Pterula gracilis]
MFTTTFAVATLLTPLLAQAIITPSSPTPGSTFNEGTKCTVAWNGDPAWEETNIQLMTGDNFQMVHLSTIATVDGSTSGSFEYDCLDVEPNSAIYFYQFSHPTDPTELAWTGRFAIADAAGGLTDPTEINTPTTTDGILWGTGKLVDASAAEPAPAYLGQSTPGTPGTSGPSTSASASVPGPSGSSAPVPSPTPEEEEEEETTPVPATTPSTRPTGPPVPPSVTPADQDSKLSASNTDGPDAEPTGAASSIKGLNWMLVVGLVGGYVSAVL